jgi:hypothetical protein
MASVNYFNKVGTGRQWRDWLEIRAGLVFEAGYVVARVIRLRQGYNGGAVQEKGAARIVPRFK